MSTSSPHAWYTTGWFIAWAVIAAVLALVTVYWGLTGLPDPANIAPGDDSSDVERRFATFWALVAFVVVSLGVGTAGAVLRTRRAAAIRRD